MAIRTVPTYGENVQPNHAWSVTIGMFQLSVTETSDNTIPGLNYDTITLKWSEKLQIYF